MRFGSSNERSSSVLKNIICSVDVCDTGNSLTPVGAGNGTVSNDFVHLELPVGFSGDRNIIYWFNIAATICATKGDFATDLIVRISETFLLPVICMFKQTCQAKKQRLDAEPSVDRSSEITVLFACCGDGGG